MQRDIYPAVQSNVVQANISNLRLSAVEAKLLFMKTDYLPDLSEKFQTLSSQVFESANVVREKAMKTELSLKSALSQLQDLNEELDEGSDEVDEIHDEQAALLQVAETAVSDMSSALDDSLNRINVEYNRPVMLGFKKALIADLDNQDVVLKRLNSNLTDLEKKRAVINEAVDELLKLGIDGVAKNIDLNVQTVQKLGAQPSQVDLVLAAIEKVKQDLQGAVKSVSFVLMVKQNQVLREKTNEVQEQINAQLLVPRIIGDKIKLIDVFGQMVEQRDAYVAAFAPIAEAVSQYANMLKSDSDSPLNERILKFAAGAKGFVGYLNKLSYL